MTCPSAHLDTPKVRAVNVRPRWLVALVLTFLIFASSDNARAAIYWANGESIGRANLDATNANPFFIGTFASSSIGRACGVATNSSHIFWADKEHDAIGRANLDGSAPNYAFITAANKPCGLAVNDTHIFWANYQEGSIGRARLDGSEQNRVFVDEAITPCGVAIDSRFIYWASTAADHIGRALIEHGDEGPPLVEEGVDGACGLAINSQHIFWGGYNNAIGRANIDGSNPTEAFITGVNRPCGVAVDGTHIYWTEELADRGGQIGRASLDGTAVNRGILTELSYPCGIALDPQSFAPISSAKVDPSFFYFSKARLDKRKGSAFIAVHFFGAGRFQVETNGLGIQILSAGKVLKGNAMRWIKAWPARNSSKGRRIRRQLRRTGRARVQVRVRFTAIDKLPSTKLKNLTLRLRQPSLPVPPSDRRGPD